MNASIGIILFMLGVYLVTTVWVRRAYST